MTKHPVYAKLQRRPSSGAVRAASVPSASPATTDHATDAVFSRAAAATFDFGSIAIFPPGPQVGREGGELAPATADRIRAQQRGGAPLESPIKQRMEGAFGHDFADVRIHADGESDALNRRLSANAFTLGSDIFLSREAADAESGGQPQSLAHELAHVVQQRGVPQGAPPRVGAADDPREREAARVAAGTDRAPTAGTAPAETIQRDVGTAAPPTGAPAAPDSVVTFWDIEVESGQVLGTGMSVAGPEIAAVVGDEITVRATLQAPPTGLVAPAYEVIPTGDSISGSPAAGAGEHLRLVRQAWVDDVTYAWTFAVSGPGDDSVTLSIPPAFGTAADTPPKDRHTITVQTGEDSAQGGDRIDPISSDEPAPGQATTADTANVPTLDDLVGVWNRARAWMASGKGTKPEAAPTRPLVTSWEVLIGGKPQQPRPGLTSDPTYAVPASESVTVRATLSGPPYADPKSVISKASISAIMEEWGALPTRANHPGQGDPGLVPITEAWANDHTHIWTIGPAEGGRYDLLFGMEPDPWGAPVPYRAAQRAFAIIADAPQQPLQLPDPKNSLLAEWDVTHVAVKPGLTPRSHMEEQSRVYAMTGDRIEITAKLGGNPQSSKEQMISTIETTETGFGHPGEMDIQQTWRDDATCVITLVPTGPGQQSMHFSITDPHAPPGKEAAYRVSHDLEVSVSTDTATYRNRLDEAFKRLDALYEGANAWFRDVGDHYEKAYTSFQEALKDQKEADERFSKIIKGVLLAGAGALAGGVLGGLLEVALEPVVEAAGEVIGEALAKAAGNGITKAAEKVVEETIIKVGEGTEAGGLPGGAPATGGSTADPAHAGVAGGAEAVAAVDPKTWNRLLLDRIDIEKKAAKLKIVDAEHALNNAETIHPGVLYDTDPLQTVMESARLDGKPLDNLGPKPSIVDYEASFWKTWLENYSWEAEGPVWGGDQDAGRWSDPSAEYKVGKKIEKHINEVAEAYSKQEEEKAKERGETERQKAITGKDWIEQYGAKAKAEAEEDAKHWGGERITPEERAQGEEYGIVLGETESYAQYRQRITEAYNLIGKANILYDIQPMEGETKPAYLQRLRNLFHERGGAPR